ncbi:MAG: hypothetical protein MRECE_22c006 [Mycoplasmataceae bacterium CE_OT135]|nr:MAG: hypothetical protein MRECE_22c006 [Mycoplasmataceae bacterium CE_OT135]
MKKNSENQENITVKETDKKSNLNLKKIKNSI